MSLLRSGLLGIKNVGAVSTVGKQLFAVGSLERLMPASLTTNLVHEFSTSSTSPSAETANLSSVGSSKGLKGQADLNSCPGHVTPYDQEMVDNLLLDMKDDVPLSDMPDPFEKNYQRCFLCRHNIELDHKNVRLLSQFVSPYTGRIYGRAITGLCIPMQREVARYIKRSRISGYMPFIVKDPKYLQDPVPYDVMKRR